MTFIDLCRAVLIPFGALGPRADGAPCRGAKGVDGEGNGKGFQFPADYEVWGIIVKKLPRRGPGQKRPKTVLVHFSLKERMMASVWSMGSQLIMSLYYSILSSMSEWCRDLECVVKNDSEHVEHGNLA